MGCQVISSGSHVELSMLLACRCIVPLCHCFSFSVTLRMSTDQQLFWAHPESLQENIGLTVPWNTPWPRTSTSFPTCFFANQHASWCSVTYAAEVKKLYICGLQYILEFFNILRHKYKFVGSLLCEKFVSNATENKMWSFCSNSQLWSSG
jgi:hypothetical protein